MIHGLFLLHGLWGAGGGAVGGDGGFAAGLAELRRAVVDGRRRVRRHRFGNTGLGRHGRVDPRRPQRHDDLAFALAADLMAEEVFDPDSTKVTRDYKWIDT
jgi:hypothetical protein